MDFRLYFNRRRQWIDVTLWDVHPSTFASWDAGRWGYYLACDERLRSSGKFGELHFVKSRVRHDGVAHELIHVLGDYLREKGKTINVYNEEKIAEWFDTLTRNFWREFGKV